MGMYCSMATTNGYCQVTACTHMAEPMPICNDENAVMPYETPKVNWNVDGMIPVEWIKKWLETCIPHYDYDRMTYIADVYDMLEDWDEENGRSE